MRLATSYPERSTHHRDIVTYFAEQNIHPGYLNALFDREQTQEQETQKDSLRENYLPQFVTPPKRWFDLLAFSFSVAGFTISLIAVIVYLSTMAKPPPTITTNDPILSLPQTELSKMDERIGRLAKAVAIIAASTVQNERSSSTPNTSNALDDTNLVEVIVPKANLRISPDLKSSAIMAVSAGTTLAVNDRATDWIQVYAPSGELLWISDSVTTKLSASQQN